MITKIRQHCLLAGIAQYKIAQACDIKATRLAEYCQGRKEIPAHHIVPLCRFFHCEPSELLGWAEGDVLVVSSERP